MIIYAVNIRIDVKTWEMPVVLAKMVAATLENLAWATKVCCKLVLTNDDLFFSS